MHPESEPGASGLLAVGDGNRIYWEASGNPQGRPALVLHGGPGSGLSAKARRFFDPSRFRVVQFDQRGCGRSTPNAGDPAADMSLNTTAHLLRDIEALRAHFGVSRWTLLGASWGCTLALAYAQRHPGRVAGMVLAGVTTTRRSEIEWLCRGLARFFPAQWARFRDGVPPGARDGDLAAAYDMLLGDKDPAVRAKAAADWHEWEAATFAVEPGGRAPERWSDPAYRLARARIVAHYFSNVAWLEDGELLCGAARLAGIPGELVQGQFDLEAPPATAWELAQLWPGARLTLVPRAPHSTSAPAMAAAIAAAVAALDARLGVDRNY